MWQDVRERILRFMGIFRRKRIESEMSEELAFHLAMRQEKYAKQGEDDALDHARRDLGSVQKWKEATRDVQRPRWLEDFLRDIKLAARMLRKSPAFTTVALLTLALAIGANTAIFSLMNGLLLRPLPVPHPDRLVNIRLQPGQFGYALCHPLFQSLEKRTEVFSDVFAFAYHTFQVRGPDGIARVNGTLVSGQYFHGLQLSAQLGRLLNPSDDHPGGGSNGPVIVISDRFWRTQYGSDPQVIGRKIIIDNVAFSIAGVTPSTFSGAEVGTRPDIFAPLSLEPLLDAPYDSIKSGWRAWWLQVGARLREGVSQQQAGAYLQTSSQQILDASIPNREWGIPGHKRSELFLKVEPGMTGFSYLRLRFVKPLSALMALVGIVLLIACLNLATLNLGRSAARAREIAARCALGASRGRLIRQLLTESLLLAIMGTLLGFALSPLASSALMAFLNTEQDPWYFDVAPDLRVLAFTAAAAIFATVLTGIAPALRSTGRDLEARIREASASLRAAERRSLLPRVLLGLEVSLALVLVAGAGLLGYSLVRLHEIPPGFDARGVILFPLEMDKQSRDGDPLAATYRQTSQELAQAPGVVETSFVMIPPLSNASIYAGFNAPGQPPKEAYMNSVGPAYFRTMRTPLVAGREFQWSDNSASEQVTILNEAAAHLLFPAANAIGQQIVDEDKHTYRVIGVVGDTKYTSLRNVAEPTVYQALAQNVRPRQSYVVVARLNGPAVRSVPAVRAIIHRVAPDIPLPAAMSLVTRIDESLATERVMATLALFFAGVALLITGIGLYGALAYATARRTGEIGIRMALGARAPDIVGVVCRENVGIALGGCTAGVAMSLVVLGSIGSFLYSTSPRNPMVLFSAVLALVVVAAIASSLPAARAARVDPISAIRHE